MDFLHAYFMTAFTVLTPIGVIGVQSVKRFFDKCTFLVFFHNLFHTADDDTII